MVGASFLVCRRVGLNQTRGRELQSRCLRGMRYVYRLETFTIQYKLIIIFIVGFPWCFNGVFEPWHESFVLTRVFIGEHAILAAT
jgi:hypothetical protein